MANKSSNQDKFSISYFQYLIIAGLLFSCGQKEERPGDLAQKAAPTLKEKKVEPTPEEIIRQDSITAARAIEENIRVLELVLRQVGDLEKKEFRSTNDITNALAGLKRAWSTYNTVSGYSSPKADALKKSLRSKLSSAQTKMYPKMRKAYAKQLNSELWINDAEAFTEGGPATTIVLVSGSFTRNKNIQESHDLIRSLLNDLRFKRAKYRWHKTIGDYSYYDLSSKKDAEE